MIRLNDTWNFEQSRESEFRALIYNKIRLSKIALFCDPHRIQTAFAILLSCLYITTLISCHVSNMYHHIKKQSLYLFQC